MKVKQALLGFAAAVVVVGGMVAGAAPALAASDVVHTTTARTGAAAPDAPAEIDTIHNVNTGRCIDDSGAGLRSFSCNGLNYQQWTLAFA